MGHSDNRPPCWPFLPRTAHREPLLWLIWICGWKGPGSLAERWGRGDPCVSVPESCGPAAASGLCEADPEAPVGARALGLWGFILSLAWEKRLIIPFWRRRLRVRVDLGDSLRVAQLSHPVPRATAGGAALLLVIRSLSRLGTAQQAVCLRTVPPGPDHLL